MHAYRLQHASVWGDRSSLRALRLLSVVIVVGAAVMLLSDEDEHDASSFMTAFASLQGAGTTGETTPVSPPNVSTSLPATSLPAVMFPVGANKSGENHAVEEEKRMPPDWITPDVGPSAGAADSPESRGTLSAHTRLDPEGVLQGNIRADAAAYNESAEAPLADVARQADAALIQTLARLGLGTDSLKLADSETRFTVDNLVYPFLRLTVRPGTDARAGSHAKIRRAPVTTVHSGVNGGGNGAAKFEEVLADSLDVWAPAAQLHKEGPNWFLITVGTAVTHSIRWEERGPNVSPDGRAQRSTPSPEVLSPEAAASESAPPRLTIVIDDVGESLSAARELLDLPYPVTLAIWPRSSHAAHIATLAHERGRQVFLHQPMEPLPESGKRMGPGGLRVGMTDEELADCLRVNLRLVPYVEGINNHMGSYFTSDAASVRQFCEALHRLRPDVMVLDSLTLGASVLYDEARTREFAAFRRTLFLDDARGKEAILKELDHGLELARQNGQAIVIGHPRPDTLAALTVWRGFRARDVNIIPLAHRPDNTNGGLPASQTEQP